MRVLSRVGLGVSAPLLVFALGSIAHPQKPLEGGNKEGPVRTPTPRVVYVNGPPQTRTVVVKPKTGDLLVVAEPGASLRIQHLRGDRVVKEYPGNLNPGEKSVIFKDLPPGQYRVVADLGGYKPSTSAPVTVKAGSPEKVELNLEQITYNVTVKLNAPSGTLMYTKGSEVPRSVSFHDNQAFLSRLTGGDYKINVIADDASYMQLNATLTVSGDRQVTYDLERKESKAFAGSTASAWILPNGWSFSSGKLFVSGSGLALPSDVNKRYYTNFQLSTQANMINGIAASFAVRLVDPQNYYLIQITGPKADEPYVLRGFIVKNGVVQRFGNPTPINQFSETLQPGKFFQVVLTMKGADITVTVEDSLTGERPKLGILSDPSGTFRIGAVGIAARENEQNEFSWFTILPNP